MRHRPIPALAYGKESGDLILDPRLLDRTLASGMVHRAGLKIAQLLDRSGFQAFFVGGFIRNKLLKKGSDNLDIATDATPEQVENILSAKKIYTKAVGKKYGTILAATKAGPVEITTFRQESDYLDKRHPTKVTFVKDYALDAKRRDFTINALYLDPITEELFDPTGKGLNDIKLKLIRFVGDPKKRINEDHLRMLRAVRLSIQLGFRLEKNTFAAIKTRAKLIQDVSGERIKAELDKIMLSDNPSDGLRLLDQIGLLRFLIPEIEAMKNFYHKSMRYHLEGSMYEHSLLSLSLVKERDLNLRYAIFFHDIGKPDSAKKVLKAEGWVIATRGHAEISEEIFRAFAKRLRFGRKSTETIAWLIRNHMRFQDLYVTKPLKQVAFASHPDFPLLLKHWVYDKAGSKRPDKQYADEFREKYLKSLARGRWLLNRINKTKTLVVRLANGEVIMKHTGLKPGKHLGQKIRQLKTQVVLGKINNLNELKKRLGA